MRVGTDIVQWNYLKLDSCAESKALSKLTLIWTESWNMSIILISITASKRWSTTASVQMPGSVLTTKAVMHSSSKMGRIKKLSSTSNRLEAMKESWADTVLTTATDTGICICSFEALYKCSVWMNEWKVSLAMSLNCETCCQLCCCLPGYVFWWFVIYCHAMWYHIFFCYVKSC